MRRWLALACLLTACLAKTKPVRMPDGQQALRIECNYTVDNCKRRAKSECDGRYDVVTQGDASCKDCGWEYNTHGQQPEGNNVYTGVLYVRCR